MEHVKCAILLLMFNIESEAPFPDALTPGQKPDDTSIKFMRA